MGENDYRLVSRFRMLMVADRGIKVPTIARFLHLKYEFDQEFSYENALADLKKLGLKPDAVGLCSLRYVV